MVKFNIGVMKKMLLILTLIQLMSSCGPKENGHTYVDLGLSSGLKWATCNIGAKSPEDFGHYFAWGEINQKEEYIEKNSLTYNQQMIDIAGDVQYDAAKSNWGGAWRMPTIAEQIELLEECSWVWITKNGVNGYDVIGPNGNSIFLPVTGYCMGPHIYYAGEYGSYWSSTPMKTVTTFGDSTNITPASRAFGLCIAVDLSMMGVDIRSNGHSVRAVME